MSDMLIIYKPKLPNSPFQHFIVFYSSERSNLECGGDHTNPNLFYHLSQQTADFKFSIK